MLFGSDNGSRLLGLSPRDLSVHGLKPYEGWESLLGRLMDGYELVKDVATPQMDAVSTVGLRYVNQVEIPTVQLDFYDYFTVSIEFPKPGFPQVVSSFLDQAELHFPGEDVRMNFTWASADSPEGTSAFILDLDLYYEPEEPISLDEARAVLADLKTKERQAFESLLQPRLREMFGEIDDA